MTKHVKTAGGSRLEFDLSHVGTRAHFEWPGSYTDAILSQINDGCWYGPLFNGRRDIVFVDLGANIGLVTLYAQDVCRRVLAVEPSAHFPLLCHLTKPFPHVTCLQAALHPRNEPVELCLCGENSTAHSTVVPVGGTSVTVVGKTLTSILKPLIDECGVVDIVKVDVEGAEIPSMTDYELGLYNNYVRAYYVEAHNFGGRGYVENRDDLISRLARQGYIVQVMSHEAIIARRP